MRYKKKSNVPWNVRVYNGIKWLNERYPNWRMRADPNQISRNRPMLTLLFGDRRFAFFNNPHLNLHATDKLGLPSSNQYLELTTEWKKQLRSTDRWIKGYRIYRGIYFKIRKVDETFALSWNNYHIGDYKNEESAKRKFRSIVKSGVLPGLEKDPKPMKELRYVPGLGYVDKAD